MLSSTDKTHDVEEKKIRQIISTSAKYKFFVLMGQFQFNKSLSGKYDRSY